MSNFFTLAINCSKWRSTEAKEHCNLVFASDKKPRHPKWNSDCSMHCSCKLSSALRYSFYVHRKLKSGGQNTNVLLLRTVTLKLRCVHPELFKKPLNSVQLIIFQLMNYHFLEYQLIYIYKYYKYFKCFDIKWRGFKPLKPCFHEIEAWFADLLIFTNPICLIRF